MHVPLVQGIYPGPTRCYKLSPPLPNPDGAGEFEYVAVCVQPGRPRHQLPELLVYAAEPVRGAPVGPSMKKLPGSQPLYAAPADDDDGWRWALLSLGVTEVTE
ncbi:hypothetical protein FG87_21675 [Nocardia vulneris]|uniref:Uncharacterized protein n=1 Tax=Nocardia vulneris TaxID=1141657 RepID=A0ABR4ZCF8_9NOCA|nr:hypothetical protein FG87_21675 [Nocardia vulneris]